MLKKIQIYRLEIIRFRYETNLHITNGPVPLSQLLAVLSWNKRL